MPREGLDVSMDLLSADDWGSRGGLQRAIRSFVCPLASESSNPQADAAVDEVQRIVRLAVSQWRNREARDWYWSMESGTSQYTGLVEREPTPELPQTPTSDATHSTFDGGIDNVASFTTRPEYALGSRLTARHAASAGGVPAVSARLGSAAISTSLTAVPPSPIPEQQRGAPDQLSDFGLPGGIELWVPYTTQFCKRLDDLQVGDTLETEDRRNLRVIELVSQQHGEPGSPKIALQYNPATGAGPERKREVRSHSGPRLSVADAVAVYAARTGDPDLLERALRAGADPNLRTPSYDRGSLLHVAIGSRSLSCARLLLEDYHASFRIRDVKCKTPLDLASEATDMPHAFGLFNEVKMRLKTASETEQDVRRICSCASADEAAACMIGWKVSIRHDDGPRTKAIVCGTKVTRSRSASMKGYLSMKGSLQGTDEVLLLLAEFKSGTRERWEPGKPGMFGRGGVPVRISATDGSYCVGRELLFTPSLLLERIRMIRRVKDSELLSACIACGDAHAHLEAILQDLPDSEAERRQRCRPEDYVMAARFATEAEVNKIMSRAPPAPPLTKADLLLDIADEAKGWATGSLEGIVDSLLRLAHQEARRAQVGRDGEQLRTLQACQQAAAAALRRGRDAMLSRNFQQAEQDFVLALSSPDIAGEGDNINLLMAHRWDIQQWLTLASLRKHVANGDLATAVQVLQTPRQFPRLGATLDVGGSDELCAQLAEAKSDMGSAESGLFHDLFESRKSDIETWRKVTLERVGTDQMDASYGLFGMVKRLIDGTDDLAVGRAIEAQREFQEVFQQAVQLTTIGQSVPPDWEPVEPRQDAAAQRADLMRLAVSALKQRARHHGVPEATLDTADDAPNPREAVVELILAACASAESKSSVEYRASKQMRRLRFPPYHRNDGSPGAIHAGERPPYAILACMEVLPSFRRVAATMSRVASFCAKGHALSDTGFEDSAERVTHCAVMQLEDFKMCRSRHGSALLAYTWGRSLLRSLERVPMDGHLVAEFQGALERAAQDLDAKIKAMRMELLSRSTVRRSVFAGVAAVKRGAAADAHAAFERAQASLDESSSSIVSVSQKEQDQLRHFLEKAAQEVHRQQDVKEYASKALAELGNEPDSQYIDGGAARSLEHCQHALDLEKDNCTPEHQALQHLKAVCICWNTAEEHLKQSKARRGVQCRSSPPTKPLCDKLTPEPEPELEPEPEQELAEQGLESHQNCLGADSAALDDLEQSRLQSFQQSTIDRADGMVALENYIASEKKARIGAALRPTEGYIGPKIELSRAFRHLEEMQRLARQECDRKTLFNELIREGESHLVEHRAIAALGSDSAETGHERGFLRALREAANDDEKDVAQECINRATKELDRQKQVKRTFESIIAELDKTEISSAIDVCAQALVHEIGPDTRAGKVVVQLQEASVHTQAHTALMLKLKTETENDPCRTPEHQALCQMYILTTSWAKGDQALLDWRYEDSKQRYVECQAAQRAAHATVPTPGYFGPKIELSPSVGDSLVKRLEQAKGEIRRANQFERSYRTAQERLAARKAHAAMQEHDNVTKTLAASPDEVQKVQLLEDEAAKEKELQRCVKNLHCEAIKALGDNDPDGAIMHYTASIACEEKGCASGSLSPELDALRKMRSLCEAWRDGNCALEEWRGTDATLAFRTCRNIAQDVKAIEPTSGYAPVDANGACLEQIQLGSAWDSLNERIKLAAREEERKDRFLQHIKDGEDLLRAKQATAALREFSSANAVAKNEDATRPVNPPQVALEEWELQKQCTERADAELARQKRVKVPFIEALDALKRSPVQDDVVWKRDDKVELALQRCKDALEQEVCADAVAHERGCTCLHVADSMTPEELALKRMIEACEAWLQGDQFLANAEWSPQLDGVQALNQYRTAQKNADGAHSIPATSGYFGLKIEFDHAAASVLSSRVSRAQKEIRRREDFLKHIKHGEVKLQHRSAPMAVSDFNAARELVYNEGETGEIDHWCAKAEAELTNQKQVKKYFADVDRALEDDDAPKAIRRCEKALQVVTESSVQQPEDPESKALRHILDACKCWKEGKDFLANEPYVNGSLQDGASPLNGKKAQDAFASCKRAADLAAEIKETRGYYGPRIQLGPGTRSCLQRLIEKAQDEIQRKQNFDKALHEGQEILQSPDGRDRAAGYLIRDSHGGRKIIDGLLGLQRRATGPNEPDNADVNTMNVSEKYYIQAFKDAVCNPERTAAMERMQAAIALLQDSLHKERRAYQARADEALVYCEGTRRLQDCVPLFERLRVATVAQDLAELEDPSTCQPLFSLEGSIRAAIAVAGVLQDEHSGSVFKTVRDPRSEPEPEPGPELIAGTVPVGGEPQPEAALESEPEPEPRQEDEQSTTKFTKTVKVQSLFDLALAWAKDHKTDMDFDDPIPPEVRAKWPGLPGSTPEDSGLCTVALESSLRAVCDWEPLPQYVTVEQATTNLHEALQTHDAMDRGNAEIRRWTKPKESHRRQQTRALSTPEGEEDEEDEDDGSDDDDEQQQHQHQQRRQQQQQRRAEEDQGPKAELDRLIKRRDSARREYVERGDQYLVSEQRLEAQRTKQAVLAAELSTSLLKVRRYRRQLQYNGVSLRVLQVAMADEEKGRVYRQRLQVEFDDHYGTFRTRIKELEAVDVSLTGTSLIVKGVAGGNFSARYNGTYGKGLELSLKPWYEFKQEADSEWKPCSLLKVPASRGSMGQLSKARRDFRINEAMMDKAVAEILRAQAQERVRLRLIVTYAAVQSGAIDRLHEKLQRTAYEPGKTEILAVGGCKGFHREKNLRTTKGACQACHSLMKVVHKNTQDYNEIFTDLRDAYEYMQEERRLHPFTKCLTLQLTHDEADYEEWPELNAGDTWKIEEIPIFEAVDEVLVQYEATETSFLGSQTVKRKTAWVSDTEQTLRFREARCRAGVVALDGNWEEGQHAATRSNLKVNHAFTIKSGGRTVSLVAKTAKQRETWIKKITDRAQLLRSADGVELVKNRAMESWVKNDRHWEAFPSTRPVITEPDCSAEPVAEPVAEPEPEPEPEPEAFAIGPADAHGRPQLARQAPRQGHHAEAKRVAQHAVRIYAKWKSSLQHSSAAGNTDDALELLQQEVKKVMLDHDWEEHRNAAVREILSLQDGVKAAVRLERALREIRPTDTLRAALWGIGHSYPQLTYPEIQDTITRYKAACNIQNVFGTIAGAQASIDAQEHLQELKRLGAEASANRERGVPNCKPEHFGMVALAMSAREDLREELKLASGILAMSRERQVAEKIARCRPYVDSKPPDTAPIRNLQQIRHERTVEFNHSEFALSATQKEIEHYEQMNPYDPLSPELVQKLAECKQNMNDCRRTRREASGNVDAEMRRLAGLGSEHWPEIFHDVPAIADLKNMEFLRSDDIGLNDYDYITPLEGRNRNKVYNAAIDGRECFLKAYDLTGTTAIAVEAELKTLHKLRHPNIVTIQSVFQHQERGVTFMYVQMPRYRGDFEKYLLDNRDDGVHPGQLRRILLGVLRAVARVHERELTHNDIKLENILITPDGDAVLSDFELCKEDKGSYTLLTCNTAETIVGGTEYCMAEERMTAEGRRRPTDKADMYSVGVVMLLAFFPKEIERIKSTRAPEPRRTLKKNSERLPDKHLGNIIECLLTNYPEKRPSARKILDDEDASSYFRRADADLPVHWSHTSNIVEEITDPAFHARICDALLPVSPDEFGLGIDQGKCWRDAGFSPTGSRDKFGRKRLQFGDNGKPGIELHKVWRVQNEEVWKQYAAGRERVADSIVRGPALDSLPGASHLPTSGRAHLHARLKCSGSSVHVILQCLVVGEIAKLELKKNQDFLPGAVVTLQESGGTLAEGSVLENRGAEIKVTFHNTAHTRASTRLVRASELTVMHHLQVVVEVNGVKQSSSCVSAHAVDNVRWSGANGEELTFQLGSRPLETCNVEVIVIPRNKSSRAVGASRSIGVCCFPIESFESGPGSEILAVGEDALVIRRPLGFAAMRGFERSSSDRARVNINETFLLHGVPSVTLHKILTNGFNERFAGGHRGCLFGEGTYLAEDIEKADQYAGAPDCHWEGRGKPHQFLHEILYPRAADHPGEVCYALVCRTAMGYPIRTEARAIDPSTGQPTRQCVALDGREASSTSRVFVADTARELVALPETESHTRQPIHYHSLVVETGGDVHRFREVVVMHGDYIYPEYVVAYRRVARPDGSPGACLAASTDRADQVRGHPGARTAGDSTLDLPPAGRGRRREDGGR